MQPSFLGFGKCLRRSAAKATGSGVPIGQFGAKSTLPYAAIRRVRLFCSGARIDEQPSLRAKFSINRPGWVRPWAPDYTSRL